MGLGLRRWLDRRQPSEPVVLSLAAVLVGLLSGIGVWAFKQLFALITQGAFGFLGAELGKAGHWTIALIPALGGLLVGLILFQLVGEERHHGVAGIIEATALAGGRLRYWRMPAKTLGAALSIGAGASVGPEDPSVQIGANLGSMFGQWLHLSDERVRALVASGAAAGIAAAFNAPIAGVFFALEIILGEIGGGAMGTIVLAAVTSAVFTQAVSGPQPAFHVPAYPMRSVWELPLFLGLGLAAGPIAAIYVRLLYLSQDFFHDRVRLPRWAKPALAGLFLGVVGVFLPQVFGVGYQTIGGMLSGAVSGLPLAFALLIAKLILTPVSIGGGFPGGVFAPALFLGAALGTAYGIAMRAAFPQLNIAPQAYAMVGMAALLAGAVHAPLTAVILLFEMTNDYRIILPLMFAVVVSLAISRRLQSDSVYTLGLVRKGIRLERGRDVDVLDSIAVREVMHPAADTLCECDSISYAADRFAQTHHHGMPVLDRDGRLVGILTLQDLDQLHGAPEAEDRTVGAVCTRELLVANPDESIGIALRRMSVRDVGRLPVVERGNPTRLAGILSRADIIRAYDAALTRRAQIRHRANQVRLGAYSGARTEEFYVPQAAPCAGKHMRDIAWPAGCVIATIRRRGQILIPRGDTAIEAGDVLVAVLEPGARQRIIELCSVPLEPA